MSCDITGLCGISSRFQLLSPCTGQVTHALLTRPPLSHCIRHSEEIRSQCFVRLACVRHAASVHPEPGSNSHIIICPEPNYSSQIALRWHNFVSLSDSLRIMILLESCEVCQFESYDSYWLSSENFILYSYEFSGLSDYPIFKVLCLLTARLFLVFRASAKLILSKSFMLVNTFFKKILRYFFSYIFRHLYGIFSLLS